MRCGLIFSLLLCSACAWHRGPATVEYGATQPIPIVHPSRDVKRWYVVVQTESFGKQVFFLDTGYAITTCDDSFVQQHNIATRKLLRKVRGISGKAKATKAIVPSFQLGGHTIEKVVCTVRDLHSTSSIKDPREFPVAGVLGMDILRQFRVRIDPVEATLTLRNPDESERLQPNIRLRREYGFGLRATTQLQVGGFPSWLIVDTGASITLLNGKKRRLRNQEKLSSTKIKGSGTSKKKPSKPVQRYRIPNLGIVGLPATDGIIYHRTGKPFTPGLLGLNILADWIQEYDWDHKEAQFTPTPEGPKIPRYTKSSSLPAK